MLNNGARPFATIESSLEFLHLLEAAIAETIADVQQDISVVKAQSAPRHLEALQLVDYKLQQLSSHVGKSERHLRDRSRLRRIILNDSRVEAAHETVAAGA